MNGISKKFILHVSNGWESTNGAAVIARHIASEQQKKANAEIMLSRFPSFREISKADELWVHCGWMPCLWRAVLLGKLFRVKTIKWVPEACYDPVRLKYHGWKKRLAGPIERFCLRHTTAIVATCDAEIEWIKNYVGTKCPPIEIVDPKRFFNLDATRAQPCEREDPNEIHILYLGRPHPLKGIEYLEAAVNSLGTRYKLRIVSNAHGEEKERVWKWCDVFVLPTLSDNFALVVAEALEHGKRVITTDGAPAWENDPHVIYLRGFRSGDAATRTRLLTDALKYNCNIVQTPQ